MKYETWKRMRELAVRQQQHTIFVYGSLLSGLHNHETLRGADFMSAATTRPEYTMLDLGAFPGVCAGGTTAIRGELWSCGPFVLSRLDRLEGHPTFYRRTHIRVRADGDEVNAEMYVLARTYAGERTCVPHGDWRCWLKNRT